MDGQKIGKIKKTSSNGICGFTENSGKLDSQSKLQHFGPVGGAEFRFLSEPFNLLMNQ